MKILSSSPALQIDDLRAEITRILYENEKLTNEVGRLRWAIDGPALDFLLIPGMTRIRAKICAVMMDGKWHSRPRLLAACCNEDTRIGAVSAHFSIMKKKHKWFAFETRHDIGYRFKQCTMDHLKAELLQARM